MKLEIVNNKKVNWSFVHKVMIKITGDTIKYEAPLSVNEIARIHFITGRLLDDYYSEEKK